MNLSFSKQINEGDTIVVSLCSYYTEIESLIASNHYFELINVDIVRENGQSTVPVNALSDICRTLVKILDDTPQNMVVVERWIKCLPIGPISKNDFPNGCI